MLGFVILAGLLLFGAVAAIRATGAYRDHRRRLALAAAAAREAEAAAARAAREAREAEAQADREARDRRHRAHPDWYISLQRGLLGTRVGPLQRTRAQLAVEQGQVQAELAAVPPAPRLLVQISTLVCLLVLPLLWIISVSQMIPSFTAMSLPPSSNVTALPSPAPVDVLYGLLWATAEISVALALAHVLHSVRADGAGGAPGWAATTFWRILVVLGAAVLIYGQYSWAPAHDMIPMNSQLTMARDQQSLDKANDAQAELLTADQQKIDDITARMPPLRERDQAMALVVTLLADGLAIPALLSLEHLAAAGRRGRLRRRVTSLTNRIASLDQREGQAGDAVTYETQLRLDALGHPPQLALVPAAAAPAAAAPAGPAAPVPPPPAPARAAPAGTGVPGAPGTTPAEPGRVRTPDDLFPPTGRPGGPAAAGPAGDDDESDDRRWTDPL